MELVIKRFDELTLQELYEILRLRVNVFVVEQHCPYPEIDGKDEFSHPSPATWCGSGTSPA